MNAGALLGRLHQPALPVESLPIAFDVPTPLGPVRRIAVCDDDLAFIRYIERALQPLDVAVTPITTPAHDEAVRVLASSGCDAALLDLHMYDDAQAGLRLLAHVRAHPETARMPLYLATGDLRAAQRSRDQLRAYGCNLLLKPFGFAELTAALCLQAPVGAA